MDTDYSDIINLPHHVSDHHPQLPIGERAAQFSPFAALNVHSEAIAETEDLISNQYKENIPQ